MKNTQKLHLLPFSVLACLVYQIDGTLFPSPVLTGPDKAYLGSKVMFQCIVPGATLPITYNLLREGKEVVAPRMDVSQAATFSLKIAMSSAGSYHCEASAGELTASSGTVHLQVVIPVSGASVTPDPSPPVMYEGSRLILRCDVTRGSHLSYTWFFNKQEVMSSALPSLRLSGNVLVVDEVTQVHAGSYSCVAGTKMRTNSRFSSSGELQVTVKVFFSVPMISLSVSKEGRDYVGNVTCRSSKGSPPVTFHLLLDGEERTFVEATESLVAVFPVAIVPGRDMGVARCLAQSEVQQLLSDPLNLEVVPVGGRAEVEVDYLYRADYKMDAVKLQCLLSRGTFPFFSWSLNNSVLSPDGDTESHTHSHTPPRYTITDAGRTLLLPDLAAKESGYYRCRARDSYDETSPWVESVAVLVQAEESTMTTIEVVAIAFCCFLMLVLAAGVAYMMNMADRQRGSVNNNRAVNTFPLSPVSNPAEVNQMDTSSVNSDTHNQTMEITV